MFKRITRWAGGRRRKAKAGAQLSAFLWLLAALDPARKRRFIIFTLRQRQPYLVLLLRSAGLQEQAGAVERLDWNEAPGTRRFVRAEFAAEVFRTAGEAALNVLSTGNKTKRELSAGFAYAGAALSTKHAWQTQVRFWRDLSKQEVPTEKAFEALRDSAILVAFLIKGMGEVEGGANRSTVDAKTELALAEQVTWIREALSIG